MSEHEYSENHIVISIQLLQQIVIVGRDGTPLYKVCICGDDDKGLELRAFDDEYRLEHVAGCADWEYFELDKKEAEEVSE